MAKWWRAPETEEDLLDRLYAFTNGIFYAGDEYNPADYIEWGGYEEAQALAKKPNYLNRYKAAMAWRIGKFGLLPVPGIQLATAPLRLKFNYSAMAGAAWAYGYTQGVGPKDLDEAKYDLLAITTVWAQRYQALDWTDIAGLPMQGSGSITEFGKRLLYILAQNGSLKFGERAFGPVGGKLSAIAFSNEILPALGEELFRLFKEDLFSGMIDEFIPGVASATSVSRAMKRLNSFYELSKQYYNFKARKLK